MPVPCARVNSLCSVASGYTIDDIYNHKNMFKTDAEEQEDCVAFARNTFPVVEQAIVGDHYLL